jgi:hypothetical protein
MGKLCKSFTNILASQGFGRVVSVASMYNAFIQLDVPIDKINHNKLRKLKIPLRIKVLDGIYVKELF